jgi:hypothetical protein
LSKKTLDERAAITKVELELGPLVRVEYVVILDWIRSRQADVMDFTQASVPATDAEINDAVDRAIAIPEWTSLGAITSVASEAEVQSAFNGCACDLILDWCGVDFEPGTGALVARGEKAVDEAECLEARANVATGELLSCERAACAVP